MWCKYFGENEILHIWDINTILWFEEEKKILPFYQKVVKYDFEVLLENKIYNKKN